MSSVGVGVAVAVVEETVVVVEAVGGRVGGEGQVAARVDGVLLAERVGDLGGVEAVELDDDAQVAVLSMSLTVMLLRGCSFAASPQIPAVWALLLLVEG